MLNFYRLNLQPIKEHLAGNKSVSHLVRRSLDSLNDEEQDAAIWASQQLISVSLIIYRTTEVFIFQIVIPLNRKY